MSKKTAENRASADQFVKELMAKIPITELYTHVTGEQFHTIQSRLKARNVLRKGSKPDETPSMQDVPNKNLLWDFAEAAVRPGKPGRGYNHIDILLLSQKVRSYKDAVQFLAKYQNAEIPEEIASSLGRDSDRRDFLQHVWSACVVARKQMFEEPGRFSAISNFAHKRYIPFEQRFWEVMDIGVWPESQVLDGIIETHGKKNKNAIADLAKNYHHAGHKAIVFPLYDRYGNFSGMTIREVNSKNFLKLQDRPGFYGLREALPHEKVSIFEGELNYVQYVAALYRKYGPNEFEDHKPYGFCTGSRSNSLASLAGEFRGAIYFPDIEERKNKEDKSTQEVVLKVYNELQAKEFWVIDWGREKNKFDLDDFICRHIEDKDVLMRLLDMRFPISEYLYRCIENEDEVLLGGNDKQKNGARIGFANAYANQIYNGADRKSLLDYYRDISEGDIDLDTKERCEDSVDDDLGDGFSAKNNCYYITSASPDGEPQRKKISDFVIKPRHVIVYQKRNVQSQGEFASEVTEGYEMHASVHFADGRKRDLFFRPEDLATENDFKKRLLQTVIDLHAVFEKGQEKALFQCATKRLSTSKRIVRFKIPGPHIRNESRKNNVLCPSLFGGTLKTFLNCEYSVIDGKVISNKVLGIEFEKTSNLRFGIYSDREHAELARIVWSDLRRVHVEEVVDRMIGFSCCTGIKHLLEPNVQSLVLFVHGRTHTYKTSTARLIQNFFGDFVNDEELATFHGTFMQVEKSISNAGANLIVYDEFKAGQNWNEAQMQELIHNLFGGKSKGRLNTHAEEKDRDPFSANVILTGERALSLESSVEARHLQLRAEAIGTDRLPLFQKLNSAELRGKFRCFGARLIAWQHNNIDELIEVYRERKVGHMKTIEEYGNKTRIATQCAMIDVGFYSFIKFCQHSGACSEDEANAAIQKFFVGSTQDIHSQIARASEMENAKRFTTCLMELLQTKTVNMAIVSGEGVKASVTYTKGNKNDVYVVKFQRKGESFYALLSFKLIIIALNNAYKIPNYFTDSIKTDLAEAGFCKLDSRGQIGLQDIPDIGESEGKKIKRTRAIVISARYLEEESDQHGQSDEF